MGSGRMGQIRAQILYANPRFELCGVVDVNLAGAEKLAKQYSVSLSYFHYSVSFKLDLT